MNDHPLKSHEIYLTLCRMDTRGLHTTDEYRLLRDLYSLVMRREQETLRAVPGGEAA